MLDTVFLTGTPEDVRERQTRAALELWELHAVVGEDGVDLVGHRPDQRLQEAGGDIEVTLPPPVAQFSDVDVEAADLVVLELLRFLAVGLGQLVDPMSLQTAMQRRAAQMRDHVLERDVNSASGSHICIRSATIAASSIGESTVLRRSFGPIGISSTDLRLRHFRTVCSLSPYLPPICCLNASTLWGNLDR